MHFTSFLTIFTLATLSTATIIDGLAPRRTAATTTTTSRAISAETVCACISGPFVVKKVNVGSLSELCTCISVLSDFVTTTTISTVLQGVRVGGHDLTVRSITDKINSCEDKDRQTCTHPDNSVPNCSRKNLCGYTCKATYKDCGGSCKKSCPTATLHPHRKRDDYWGHRVQRSCQSGWTACGVSGGGPREWECVETQNDLVSCGGCTSGLVSSLTGQSTGADCSSIPHVADVSCVAGGCAVNRCLPGFKVAASGQSCEREDNFFRNTLQAAAAYGLDHIPFK